jgi:hypothetical protein
LLATAAAASTVLISCSPPLEDASAFQAATNIVFVERGPDRSDRAFRVSDKNEVERLLAEIRLQRKEPCPCGHIYEAVFQTPSGEIRVSFCDHCFDVLTAKDPESYQGARLYRTPKRFYAEFQQLAKSKAYEPWTAPGPPTQ